MTLDRRALLTGLTLLPATAPVSAWARQVAPVRIPFTRDSGVIVVEVLIEGRPALAAIDNGAAFSVLDQAFATAIGKTGGGRMRLNDAPVRVAASVGVALAGIRIATSPALSNLGMITAAQGRPVAMLLGYELFAAWVVQFDFDNNEMTLHPREFEGPDDATLVNLTALPGRKFAAPVTIGRHAVPAMIDLGAGGAVLMSATLATRLGLDRRKPQSTAAASVFIGDQTRLFVSRLVTGPVVRFAGLALREAPLEILAADEPVFSRYGVTIGAPVLARYDLWLDLPGRRMWARPNRRAREPFERDRIGLQGYMDGPAFKIMHVREKSPAFRAGLSTRDRVVAVNQRPAGEVVPELKYAAPAGKAYELTLSDGRTVSLTAADFY